MAYTKQFIVFGKKAAFNAALTAGEIKESSIVFIEDTKQIWTQGTIYSCPFTAEEVQDLLDGKVDKVAGKSLVADDLVTKLTGLKTQAEITKDIDDAVKALDATVTSTDGKNVQVKVTETDGKITAVNITTDNTAKQSDLTAEVTRATEVEEVVQAALDSHKADEDKKHIPEGGREGQVLAWKADGEAKWANTLDVFAGLEDLLSYGVEWDVTVASPVCTRIGNPLLHKSLPVQSAYRGCVAQKDKIIYWLDPDDWSKKENGEDAILDGTDGTVRVKTPKFYGKSEEDGDKRRVRISMIKIDDTWIEIPEMLIDAYRSTVLNTVPTTGYLSTLPANSAISVVNTTTNCRGGNNRTAYDTYLDTNPYRSDLGKPRTNAGRPTMRNWARNAGSEMLSYEQYKWVFYWAYVIEYANFNCQATFNEELTAEGYKQGGLGDGVTTWDGTNWNNYNGYYALTPCGHGNDIGNYTGIKDLIIPETVVNDTTTVATKTFKMPRWRGFDNPFGDIWTNLDGIIIDADADNHPDNMNYVYTTSDPEKYGDTVADIANMRLAGLEVHTDGYTKYFDLGSTGEIIPKVMGGSTTTYKCDYHWTGSKNTTLRTLLIGGRAFDGGIAGFSYFYSGSGVALAAALVGFRTVNVL